MRLTEIANTLNMSQSLNIKYRIPTMPLAVVNLESVTLLTLYLYKLYMQQFRRQEVIGTGHVRLNLVLCGTGSSGIISLKKVSHRCVLRKQGSVVFHLPPAHTITQSQGPECRVE